MVEKYTQVLEKVRDYLRRVNEKYPIEKAILFGSYATGRSHEASDIDLAIFSRVVTERNRLKIAADMLRETSQYRLDIQPLVFSYQDYLSGENDFIREQIKRKGIVVFSQGKER